MRPWYQKKWLIITGFLILTGAAILLLDLNFSGFSDELLGYAIWIAALAYLPAMLASHRPLWLWPIVLLCAFVVLTIFIGSVTKYSNWFEFGGAIYIFALIAAGASQFDMLDRRFGHR